MAALSWINKNYPNASFNTPYGKVSIDKAVKADQAFTKGVQTAMRWAIRQWRGQSSAQKPGKMGLGKRKAMYDQGGSNPILQKKKRKVGPKERVPSFARRYHVLGRTGPKFGRSRKVRYDKFVKFGSVIKLEDGGVLEGTECVYVGHYSLPILPVLKVATMAMARNIARSLNLHTQDPNEDLGYGKATTFTVYYRDAMFGETKSTNTAVASFGNIVDLAGWLQTAILAGWAATETYYEVVSLYIYDAANEPVFKCAGGNVFFEIVGNSNLQIQNRTLANDTVGDNQNRSALDITNNPLRGKRYDGYGNIHPLKFNDITTLGTIPQLHHEDDYGVLALNPETATNWTANAKQMLSKPPMAACFGNTNRHKYVMIGPGEIRRSKCKGVIKVSLNNLLKMYSEQIRGNSNFSTVNDALCRKGASVFYGFEKLCDVRDSTESASIAVGWEANVTVSAVCRIRKITKMNALNTLTTS